MNQLGPILHESTRSLADVRVAALATAVPRYKFGQDEAMERVRRVVPGFAHMTGVFASSGIETRYSSVPLDWYDTRRGWRESNAVYVENALDLLEQAAGKALAGAALTPRDIDAIVLVSSTGLAVPSLDALLCNRMGFSPNVERTPIFGLGCAGGTAGVARASQIARARPGANVLLLVVELGGLNVHYDPESAAMFVATALFGDGAAAVVLNAPDAAKGGAGALLRVGPSGEHLWRASTSIMGWEIMDDGWAVVLSGTLPQFVEEHLRPATLDFLRQNSLTRADIDGYVMHPGGPKVMAAVETALGLPSNALSHARSVLRDYGNMSAPTVLFVLERTLQAGARGRHLMAALGPGFTASFAILEL